MKPEDFLARKRIAVAGVSRRTGTRRLRRQSEHVDVRRQPLSSRLKGGMAAASGDAADCCPTNVPKTA